jgi:hypothetical protein
MLLDVHEPIKPSAELGIKREEDDSATLRADDAEGRWSRTPRPCWAIVKLGTIASTEVTGGGS